jgi:hypothetical protein
MIRVGRALLLTFGFALVASSHAADNPVTLHELDLLTQALTQGRVLTRQDILGIFHVMDTGVRAGQGLEYRNFAQPGIEKLSVGTLQNSDAVLRLDVVLDSSTCFNAEGTIKRYDLKYSPPADGGPYARGVGFSHEYGGQKYITSAFEVSIPVQPAFIPISQLTDTSCVSEIMVFVYPHPQPRLEIPVYMKQLKHEAGYDP